MDGSKTSPSRDMLPPFRVRQVRQPTGDGVIRLKKHEYDDLLKTQPSAALRYMDESDGEVILVGSSLELDQRLQEPVENAPRTHAGVLLDLYATGSRPLHTFDVEKSDDVLEAWQHFDQRTAEEGQKAKSLFFGRKQAPSQPTKENRQQAVPPRSVRFGQPSPPRGLLEIPEKSQSGSSHASRWAAYGNVPVTFDHARIPVSPPEPEEKELLPSQSSSQSASAARPKSTNEVHDLNGASEVSADAAGQQVRTFTLQIPSNPKEKKEHQPLLETFWKSEQEEAKSKGQQIKSKEYQPLLDMFEKRLNKLGTEPPQNNGRANLAISSTANAVSPRTKETVTEASNLVNDEPSRLQTPGELLTSSIQSLLSGMGQLASAFKLTNSELQQQVSIAQRDFPNNVERAIKSSSASIDSLIRALSQAQSPHSAIPSNAARQSQGPIIAELDDEKRDSPPIEMEAVGTREAASSKEGPRAQSSAAILKELQAQAAQNATKAREDEQKRQNDRVDSAVEQMRLALLAIGWRAPATPERIYTRADVLEDFFAYFEKMRVDLRKVQVDEGKNTSSKTLPVSPEMKELEQPAQQASKKSKQPHPYMWDLDFDPDNDEWMNAVSDQDVGSKNGRQTRFDIKDQVHQDPVESSSADPFQFSYTPQLLRWGLQSAPAGEQRDLESMKIWKPLEPKGSASSSTYTFEPHRVLQKTAPTIPILTPSMSTLTNGTINETTDKTFSGFQTGPEYNCKRCIARFYNPDTLHHHIELKHGSERRHEHKKERVKEHKDRTKVQLLNEPDLLGLRSPAELADESVLEKYPPVSQLLGRPVEGHRSVSRASGGDAASRLSRYTPLGASGPSPLRFHHSSQNAPPPRPDAIAKPPAPVVPRTLASSSRSATRSTLWESSAVFSPTLRLRDMSSAPGGVLSPQASMPSLNTAYKQQKSLGDSSTGDIHGWQPSTYEPLRRAETGIRKTTSTSNLLFRPGAFGRSNTIAGTKASPVPTARFVAEQSIEKCKNQLVEMGFERSRSETVAEAVMGSLDRAIDILDEDENARRQAKGKGKGKAKAMPGAFDEELYG